MVQLGVLVLSLLRLVMHPKVDVEHKMLASVLMNKFWLMIIALMLMTVVVNMVERSLK